MKNRDQQVAVSVMVMMAEALRKGGSEQTPATFQVVTPEPNSLGDGLGKRRLEVFYGPNKTGLFALHDELTPAQFTKQWAELVILTTADSVARGDLKVKMRMSGSTRSALVYFGFGKLAASVFAPEWIDANMPSHYQEVLGQLHSAIVASTLAAAEGARSANSVPGSGDERGRRSPTATSAAPPQLSPDGKWWWTGSEWVPAKSTSQPAAARASTPTPQGERRPAVDTKNLARQHHYIFAFRLLPNALFRDPTLLQGPSRDQMLLRVWDVAAVAARDFSQQTDVPEYVHHLDFNPIRPDGLSATTINVSRKSGTLIEMPIAVRPTEAIWALVIYEERAGSRPGRVPGGVRYFVLSRAAQALNNVPTNYVAEITPQGRQALGPVPRLEDAGTSPEDRAALRKADRDMFIQLVEKALTGDRSQ